MTRTEFFEWKCQNCSAGTKFAARAGLNHFNAVPMPEEEKAVKEKISRHMKRYKNHECEIYLSHFYTGGI